MMDCNSNRNDDLMDDRAQPSSVCMKNLIRDPKASDITLHKHEQMLFIENKHKQQSRFYHLFDFVNLPNYFCDFPPQLTYSFVEVKKFKFFYRKYLKKRQHIKVSLIFAVFVIIFLFFKKLIF